MIGRDRMPERHCTPSGVGGDTVCILDCGVGAPLNPFPERTIDWPTEQGTMGVVGEKYLVDAVRGRVRSRPVSVREMRGLSYWLSNL